MPYFLLEPVPYPHPHRTPSPNLLARFLLIPWNTHLVLSFVHCYFPPSPAGRQLQESRARILLSSPLFPAPSIAPDTQQALLQERTNGRQQPTNSLRPMPAASREGDSSGPNPGTQPPHQGPTWRAGMRTQFTRYGLLVSSRETKVRSWCLLLILSLSSGRIRRTAQAPPAHRCPTRPPGLPVPSHLTICKKMLTCV